MSIVDVVGAIVAAIVLATDFSPLPIPVDHIGTVLDWLTKVCAMVDIGVGTITWGVVACTMIGAAIWPVAGTVVPALEGAVVVCTAPELLLPPAGGTLLHDALLAVDCAVAAWLATTPVVAGADVTVTGITCVPCP